MIDRVYNFRDGWKFSSVQNESSNFYPVTSAISMDDLDSGYSMTVMNDRSQSGSVNQNGRIELMQYRRIFNNDNVNINEYGAGGLGVSTLANYYVQFYNRNSEISF